jgi:starch synthase
MVASECVPFAKTGGLGDVVSGLAKALVRMGHEVRIVLPRYYALDRDRFQLEFLAPSCVHLGNGEEQWVGVMRGSLDHQVPVWFVECDRFFGRAGLYHDEHGDFLDNAYRFSLLSKAALQITKDRAFYPDIIHLHDWQSAPTALFLKTWDRIASPLSPTGSVLTIHNIGYQGVYHAGVFSYLGVGGEHWTSDTMEDHGRINLLKIGIAYSDQITTVSPTHAAEILTPEGGQGLAPYLNNRRSDLTGILNGIDYDRWNPETDPFIPHPYRPDNLAGKKICKTELQKEMGLDVRPDLPLFAVVSRFASQKGFDLLREALPRALGQMAMQFVALGSGDPETETFFRTLAAHYPGQVGCTIGFSEPLSHRIEAGSDFFVMPSIYEPCGLNQIYSLKYGTLPIVRSTGGLADSVENYQEQDGSGTGFKFHLATPQALFDTIGWAVSTWFDRPHHIAQLQQAAMSRDFSWDVSTRRYLEVYDRARDRRLTQLKVEDPSGYEHHLAGTVDPKLTEFQAQRPRRGTKKLKAKKSAPAQKADKKEKKKTKKKSKAKR